MKKLMWVAVIVAGFMALSTTAWADSCDFGHHDRYSRDEGWSIRYSVGHFPRHSHQGWRDHHRSHRRPVVIYRESPRTVIVPAASVDTVVVNVMNDNGSYTPVTLRRQGNVYIGPRGEQYLSLPTAEQLKAVYGLK